MRPLRLTGFLCISAALLAQVGLAVAMMVANHTGHHFLIITGASMEPTYKLGSALVLKNLHPDDINAGDAVTYTSVEGTLTTHRVISLHTVDGHRYARTQGDANREPDPNFTPMASVIGTPVLHVPSGGRVASLLLSPLGRLLAYGPPLLALLLVEVRLICARLRATQSAVGTTQEDTGHSARPRRSLRSCPRLVPMTLAVLVSSLALGTFVERSTALFTVMRTTGANAVSTSTLTPATALSASGSLTSIRLTWIRSTSGYATGYDIYRSGTSGGPYTRIGSVAGGGTQSYTDSSLALGTFYYVVRTRAQNWFSTSSNQATASVVML